VGNTNVSARPVEQKGMGPDKPKNKKNKKKKKHKKPTKLGGNNKLLWQPFPTRRGTSRPPVNTRLKFETKRRHQKRKQTNTKGGG